MFFLLFSSSPTRWIHSLLLMGVSIMIVPSYVLSGAEICYLSTADIQRIDGGYQLPLISAKLSYVAYLA